MAEPTLKDVLDAIAKLDAKVDRRVDELRAEMVQRFDELDAELTLHAKVHRKIERSNRTSRGLKGRPPRTARRPTRRAHGRRSSKTSLPSEHARRTLDYDDVPFTFATTSSWTAAGTGA